MDKKNFLLGIICLFAAFTMFVRQERHLHDALPQATTSQKTPVVTSQTPVMGSNPPATYKAPEIRESQLITLENDFIKVHFSKIGGAIHSIALKKYPAQLNSTSPYIFNHRCRHSH